MDSAAAAQREVRSLVRTGVVLACLAVTVQTALYLVDVYAFDRRIAAFDVDAEGGLTAWAGSMATFSAGLVALLLLFVGASPRLTLAGFAAASTFLSLDDALALHERLFAAITRALDVSTAYARLWPVFYIPLLAWGAAIVLRLARTKIWLVRRVLIAALILLVCAVALEIGSFALVQIAHVNETAWPYTLEVSLEEAAELAGWILLTTGLAADLLVQSAALNRAPASIPREAASEPPTSLSITRR
jgi:hypothetical protein